MIVKLLIASMLHTDFYLVVDSDVMAMRPIGLAELFTSNKASYFSGGQQSWYNASSELLQISIESDAKCAHVYEHTFGATPSILHKTLALNVLQRLVDLHGKDWLHTVMATDHLGWTEFTMYHLCACQQDRFDKHHLKGPIPFYSWYSNLDVDIESMFGQEAKALFAVFQDAFDHMTVRNVLRTFSTVFPAQMAT